MKIVSAEFQRALAAAKSAEFSGASPVPAGTRLAPGGVGPAPGGPGSTPAEVRAVLDGTRFPSTGGTLVSVGTRLPPVGEGSCSLAQAVPRLGEQVGRGANGAPRWSVGSGAERRLLCGETASLVYGCHGLAESRDLWMPPRLEHLLRLYRARGPSVSRDDPADRR